MTDRGDAAQSTETGTPIDDDQPAAEGDQPERRRRTTPPILRVLGSSWLLGTLLTITAMPLWIPAPGTGLDPSWQAAMHVATRSGLDFGSGLDFTYGPLGFLAIPSLYYVSTGVLAGLFTFTLRLVTVVAVLWSARRSLGLPLALAAAYLAAHALLYVDPPQAIPILLLLASLTLLERDDRRRFTWVAPVAGATAGLLVLVKFNIGVAALALGVLTAWNAGRGRWRAEATLAGTFLATVVAGWLLTGNRLGDLPAWWRNSLEIASGYSTAMALETERSSDPYLLLLVLAVVSAAVWLGTAGWSSVTRLAAGLAVAGTLFVGFKHGFVRHDGHVVSFFGVLPAVVLSLRMARRWMVPLFAVVVLVFVVANPFPNAELIDPRPSFEKVADFARDMTSPAELRRTIAATRDLQRAAYALDDATLEALAGHRLHIDPWESSVAWAYPELDWAPLPMFQSYFAFTAALDKLNAEALVAPDGPTRILRQTPRSVDARNADFESPAAVLAMLCNFAEAFTAGEWQVLARTADRCGRTELFDRVTVKRGEWVDVPTTTGGPALVMARVAGLEGPAVADAVALLYKAPETFMEVDDGTAFRLVPETASGPLLMAAPPELGYSAPFGFTRRITRFRLFQRHDLAIDRFDQVTVEFVRIPLRPAPGAGPP